MIFANRYALPLLLLAMILTVAAPTAAEQEKEFTGRPISLDLRDAPLGDIFRLFQELSGKKLVLEDPEIGERIISIDVDDMPWDQVLDLIRRTHHLKIDRAEGVIRIQGPDWIEKEGLGRGDLLLETALFRGVREKAAGVTTQVLPVGGPLLVIDSEWVRNVHQQERILQETFGLSAVGILAAPKILMSAELGENVASITTSSEEGTTLIRFKAWPSGEGPSSKVRVRAELTYEGVPFETEVIATPGKPFMLGGRVEESGDYVFLAVTPWLDRGPDISLSPEVRVGTEGLGELQKTHQVPPSYPEEMKKEGQEGLVVLDIVVAEDGRVDEVEILDATNPRFAQAAEDAVWQWRYEPPMLDGEPVRAAMVVKVDFRLRQEETRRATSPGSSE